MPTYDYACDECGHEFELFQQMSAAVKRKCPECGRLKLRRLIGTGAGVLFKGGGFYETDYRSDSYKKAAAAEKKAQQGDKPDGKSSTAGKKDGGKKDPAKGGAKKPSAGAKKSSDS